MENICRCLDETCEAYVYTGTGPGNCLLISTNSTAEEGETFELEDSAAIYEKGSAYNFLFIFVKHNNDICGQHIIEFFVQNILIYEFNLPEYLIYLSTFLLIIHYMLLISQNRPV